MKTYRQPSARRCSTRTETDLTPFLDKVRPIIAAVRAEGDAALARFARQFDKAPVQANEIAATTQSFRNARKHVAPAMLEAMDFAAENIRNYHQQQKSQRRGVDVRTAPRGEGG